MFYCCDHCHYVFSADVLPHRCPECGEKCVCEATKAEWREHLKKMGIVHEGKDLYCGQ